MIFLLRFSLSLCLDSLGESGEFTLERVTMREGKQAEMEGRALVGGCWFVRFQLCTTVVKCHKRSRCSCSLTSDSANKRVARLTNHPGHWGLSDLCINFNVMRCYFGARFKLFPVVSLGRGVCMYDVRDLL